MTGKRDKAWSVAGAARSARETRIATVRHLREAPIARLWQMTRLQAAYQLHVSHLGHPAAAQLVLFGGMGYRPPYPADWQAAGDLIVGDEARYLAEAGLYILTPRMCDVVIAAAQSLTVADLELLSEDDLPSATGLVVLPHPVIVRAMGGDLADDRAFTWRFRSQIQRRAGAGAACTTFRGADLGLPRQLRPGPPRQLPRLRRRGLRPGHPAAAAAAGRHPVRADPVHPHHPASQ